MITAILTLALLSSLALNAYLLRPKPGHKQVVPGVYAHKFVTKKARKN